MDFLRRFDGSGLTPRQVQVDFLEWLGANWHRAQLFAGNLPTGVGKGRIAKAIQLATGGHIITMSNPLLDQYGNEYPTTNTVKGKTHYNCKSGLTCSDWQDELQMDPCPDCPYTRCRRRGLEEPSIFNPASFYYMDTLEEWVPPRTLIVDEAHLIANTLQMMSGTRLRHGEYRFPKNCNDELTLTEWLRTTISNLKVLAETYKSDPKKRLEVQRMIKTLSTTRQGILENPQNYAIWVEEGTYRQRKELFLNLRPIKPPRFLVDRFFKGVSKLVLMSATLPETDVYELFDTNNFMYKDLDSPIPASQRQIRYRPTPFQMNYQTDPSRIAAHIESILDKHPGERAIIHASYALAARLKPHFKRPIITNTKEDKAERLAQFIAEGGVFLASGCAEGIDLKGDLCRVNIIPALLFPNLGDPIVKKRKAAAGGNEWYDMQTLTTLIQQAGRSTRGPDDHSVTYVCDPNFPRLFSRRKHRLPKSFKEAIVWSNS